MRVLFAASVGVATLGTNVDYGRLAASHLVHHFVGHRLGRTLALLRNNWNEIAERNDFLDLFENFLVLAMRNKDALDSCRLRHSQKLGDCAIILARFRDFVFIVRFRVSRTMEGEPSANAMTASLENSNRVGDPLRPTINSPRSAPWAI